MQSAALPVFLPIGALLMATLLGFDGFVDQRVTPEFNFMELPFSVFAGPAALVVAAATALTLVFGSAGAFAMLSRRALPYLRNE